VEGSNIEEIVASPSFPFLFSSEEGWGWKGLVFLLPFPPLTTRMRLLMAMGMAGSLLSFPLLLSSFPSAGRSRSAFQERVSAQVGSFFASLSPSLPFLVHPRLRVLHSLFHIDREGMDMIPLFSLPCTKITAPWRRVGNRSETRFFPSFLPPSLGQSACNGVSDKDSSGVGVAFLSSPPFSLPPSFSSVAGSATTELSPRWPGDRPERYLPSSFLFLCRSAKGWPERTGEDRADASSAFFFFFSLLSRRQVRVLRRQAAAAGALFLFSFFPPSPSS